MGGRIAILGGAGFVGCHLARLLLQRGEEVVLFDRTPPNGMGRHILDDAPRPPEIVEGDATVPTEVAALLARGPHSAVVNLAALQMLEWCNRHPLRTYEVNVLAPLVLFDLAAHSGVPRVVHVSSTGALVAIRRAAVDERHPTLDVVEGHPAGHYGASKAMSEIAALAFARVQHLDVVVLRFPSVYGFGTPHQTYLAQAVQARAAGRSFTAPVGGDDRRDYLYVLDAADALARAIAVPASGLSQRLFMIGLGRLHTDRDVAALLETTIGEGFSPVEASLDCIRADYDISAAERDLGYVPRYSLERGLRDYVGWAQGYLRSHRADSL